MVCLSRIVQEFAKRAESPNFIPKDNYSTMGGDGECIRRAGEVRAGTTSPMHDHKGFKLQ